MIRFLKRGQTLPPQTKPAEPQCCETCRFHVRQSCHRFPPALHAKGYLGRSWPAVEWGDWCGEWKP